MKMKNVTKMAIAGAFCAMLLTGCELFNADKKAEIRDKAHAAIIEFLETKKANSARQARRKSRRQSRSESTK